MAASGLAGPSPAIAQESRVYRLGTGDRLRVIVFGEEDLSGEFEIAADGTISMPLIGTVTAEGFTVSELQGHVGELFRDGYLLDPQVSIEVLNYRPFYILGEVNNPGSYPYVSGMTVLNAVALAGGFTYRADEDEILLKRPSGDSEAIVGLNTPVLPGDILTVDERFF